MAVAKLDENSRPTLTALSSANDGTIVTCWADPTTHRLLVDNTGSTGTVTSVSVVTANGISGTVATATTTPAITLSLGAITPSTVNGLTCSTAAIGFTIAGGTTSKTLTVPLDASVSGTNTGDNVAASTSVAGLAPQATAPAAGLYNYIGITNGETAYTNKALFNATSPSTQAFGDAAAVGTSANAARQDHKHAMMAAPTTVSGNAGTATKLAATKNIWGVAFDGSGDISGSQTGIGDMTGGASSMTITSGTGASRTLTFKTTTAGSTATTALTLAADQSATFANTVNATTFVGALTGTASGNLTSGGALGTPSSGTLTSCTGLPIAGLTASTSTALGVGSIELGAASDTTLSRTAAGVLAVEGMLISGYTTTATAAGTTTMDITYSPTQVWTGTTTQTIKLPTTSVVAGQTYNISNNGTSIAAVLTVQSSGANTVCILGWGCSADFVAVQATPTTAAHWTFKKYGKNVITATSYTTDTGTSLNCDYWDEFNVTAQAGALKLNNPTGTPKLNQNLVVCITGTAARALTYDTQFLASTVALPTTTVTTAQLNMGFKWNGTSWVILASC